jgi:hypothetical protein
MTARPARRPAWTLEPLVVCADGPLAHQWFTADDWTDRLDNAIHRLQRGQRRSPELDYQPTATTAHPTYPDITGRTLSYTPAAAQAQEDAA